MAPRQKRGEKGWLRIPLVLRITCIVIAFLQVVNFLVFWTYETGLADEQLRFNEVRLCNTQDRCRIWIAGSISAAQLQAEQLYHNLQRIEISEESKLAVFIFQDEDPASQATLVFDVGDHICTSAACLSVSRIVISDQFDLVDLNSAARICDGNFCAYLNAYESITQSVLESVYTIKSIDQIDVPESLVVIALKKGRQLETVLGKGEWTCDRGLSKEICEGVVNSWEIKPVSDLLSSVELIAATTEDQHLAQALQNEWQKTILPSSNQNFVEFLKQSNDDPARSAETTLSDDVTLVTQLSVSRLSRLLNIAKSWDGPINAVIYLTNPWDLFSFLKFWNEHCLTTFSYLLKNIKWIVVKPDYRQPFREYPINKLRNIGINASSSKYVFVIDADFVPDPALYLRAKNEIVPQMAREIAGGELFAYVINCVALTPEASHNPPKNINELREMFQKKSASLTSEVGHTVSRIQTLLDWPVWQRTRALLRYYEVCFESQWEPYYILPKSAPLYDERFKNQGGDKQQHAVHLNALGYRFRVVHEHFIYHMAHEPSMAWPGGQLRAGISENTFSFFEDYLPELEARYGKFFRTPRCSNAFNMPFKLTVFPVELSLAF